MGLPFSPTIDGFSEEELAALRGDTDTGPETVTYYHGDRPDARGNESFVPDWRARFRTELTQMAKGWAEMFNQPVGPFQAWVLDGIDQAYAVMAPELRGSDVSFDTEEGIGTVTPRKDPSVEQYKRAWRKGINHYSIQLGVDLLNLPKAGSGRGSGGPRKPSAQDIRNMFDEKELTEAVKGMWGAHLLEDAPDAQGLAKQYIEAIVRTGGEKEIDFKTFVQERIKKTQRYQQIYSNKPEGMDDLEYIAPYVSAAQQAVGGGQGNKQMVGSLAAGGAALGASQDAFAGRLARTDAHTGSQGFINGLESRMREVNGVLRG